MNAQTIDVVNIGSRIGMLSLSMDAWSVVKSLTWQQMSTPPPPPMVGFRPFSVLDVGWQRSCKMSRTTCARQLAYRLFSLFHGLAATEMGIKFYHVWLGEPWRGTRGLVLRGAYVVGLSRDSYTVSRCCPEVVTPHSINRVIRRWHPYARRYIPGAEVRLCIAVNRMEPTVHPVHRTPQ